MSSKLFIDPESLSCRSKEAEQLGKELAEQYQSALPYPHICIDDFLPLEILEKVRAEAAALDPRAPEYESPTEQHKTSINPNSLSLYSRSVFGALNSPAFLRFLEEMTGIEHLIPDPYFFGAGIHRTETGGFLGIHADFNLHREMRLERRLNVLIYLNPGWQPGYGGEFEVWDKSMKKRHAAFEPIMNRMCCFSTTSQSFHGNPEPVNHPEGKPRLSIALYYYTATWSGERVDHSTIFRARPGSTDAANRSERVRTTLRRWLPPPMFHLLLPVLRRIGC
jgi:Rps23 Pro-64 3,4-dihydroxylase Tpa1-like proline 4-hydroxylase